MLNAADLRPFAIKSAGKLRNKTVPWLRFPFFLLSSLTLSNDIWVKFYFWVTRATVNAVDLRPSARELVGKRKNERVFKLRFSFFAPCP